ncbi:Tn3 family transposase [Streptomyces sp. NBC_00091]|uniref:Tn3 family transposase n=1 Tax=Streptomyces sp. NBC_00091 TaxID=2975648 RepID=UPI00224D06B7|nr:Tn3 family transposase [Streptomyces sp. NBC_00091]MCX5376223.1 transposase [Streptomyces sp. NBC_00091]
MTAEWYIREETLREANICLVNYHQKLPVTAMFGSGPCPPPTGSGSPRGDTHGVTLVNFGLFDLVGKQPGRRSLGRPAAPWRGR